MGRIAYIQFKAAPKVDTTYRIELHKSGYSGTDRRLNGTGRYFDHNYQSLNPREPQKTVLLDSRLTLSIQARENADITLLEDIFTSDPGVYTMRKYVNDTLEWTGTVDTDRVRYPRMGFPFEVQIVARDIEPAKGENFTLTTGRVTIIEAIAQALPLGLPIRTVTSWKGTGVSASEDYLAKRYIDRTALRTFARTGDEPDEAITKYRALELLCKNFGLLLHQSGNAWRIVQLSALTAPETTRVYSYNSSGTATGSAVTDLRVSQDRENLFIRPISDFIGARSYKEVEVRFDHRTTVSGIQFPSSFRLEDPTFSRVFSQFFTTDGTQSIRLTGNVRARFDDTIPSATFFIQIKALSRYWNTTTNAWQAGLINNELDMTDTELSGGKLFFEAPVSILTSDIPDTAGNQIEITIFIARNEATATFSDFTDYTNFNLDIINPSVEDGNSTAIDYKLTQVRNHSERYNHGAVWFGDGPTSYAVSAISEDSAGATLTASNWGRQGETLNQPFFQVLTREVMDTQRNASRALNVRLFGAYSPNQILVDGSDAYLFIGGAQSGKQNEWIADLIKIQVQTAESDTFEIIYRTTADASTGSAPATGGGGGTGGGISQAFADNRYNRRTLNLSDVTNVSDARHNLGLGDPGVLIFNEPLFDNVVTGSDETYLDIRNASPFERGVVTNEAQTFDGVKTFQKTPVLASGILKSPSALRIEDTASTTLRKLKAAQATETNDVVVGARSVSTTAPLAGGGNLTANRTLTLNRNEPLYLNGSNLDVRNHATGQRGVLLPTAQDIFGDKTFQANAKLANAAKLISNEAFTPGFSGAGMQLERASDKWNLELDNLFIRGALFASEFIINQISALNGSDILSAGRGKVETITTATPGEEQVVISDPQGGTFASFALDDIVIIQQFRPTNAILKRIVRQVADVSGNNIILSTTAGAPADTGVIEVGDLIVAIGNVSDPTRRNSIYRSVVDANNPFTRVFAGVASYADWLSSSKIALAYGNLNGSYGYSSDVYGFAAGLPAGSNITIDPSSGLRLRAGTSVLAQLSGDTFKIGTANYIQFDSSDGELDINTDKFKLTTAGIKIDSALDKKIIVNNGTFDTIAIGNFDFGAKEDNEIVATTTTGTTTSIFTSGTIGYPTGQITSTIGVIETDNRATDQLIISGFRQIDAIKGKWARIRFDWTANGYDSSLPAFAVGYEISYPGGPTIQNVARDPEDTVRSGSVDTGFVFIPDDATPRITISLLAPDGGLIIGDVHERVGVQNIVVEYKDDTTYVDIGNPGMRIYKSGGLEGVFFDGDNSEIVLKKLGIGEWSFRILNNSNLGLFYKETLRQTFTIS